jgi:hypothetical protein
VQRHEGYAAGRGTTRKSTKGVRRVDPVADRHLREATAVEVKIGVQNVAREITFDTDASAEEVAAAVTAAVEKGSALTLTGEKGRQLLVPAGVIGYVQLGETEKRGVGFGNI